MKTLNRADQPGVLTKSFPYDALNVPGVGRLAVRIVPMAEGVIAIQQAALAGRVFLGTLGAIDGRRQILMPQCYLSLKSVGDAVPPASESEIQEAADTMSRSFMGLNVSRTAVTQMQHVVNEHAFGLVICIEPDNGEVHQTVIEKLAKSDGLKATTIHAAQRLFMGLTAAFLAHQFRGEGQARCSAF